MMLVKKYNKYKIHQYVRFILCVVNFNKVKMSVYFYEIDGVLIDTVSPPLLTSFKPFVDKADIEQVAITHYHEDHTGGAGYLQHTYNIPIYMNENTIESCQEKTHYPFYRKIF